MKEAQPEKKTAWELTAEEIIYPQTVLGMTVYAHMRPYEEYPMKELLAVRNTRMAPKPGNILDLKESGKSEIVKFFWDHFIRLSGESLVTPNGETISVEEQTAFIKKHPRLDIPTTAVLGGYGGMSVRDPEGKSLLDLAEDNTVSLQQLIGLDGQELRISMTHHFRQETEADNLRYQTATGSSRIYTRRQEYERVTNYDIVGQMYNDMIRSIDGMTINGLPCVEQNKDEWVKKVPFWHKDYALENLFRGSQAKNA